MVSEEISLNLGKYIKIYDNTLQPKVISSLIKFLNNQKDFSVAATLGGVDTEIRDVREMPFFIKKESPKSHIHWTNLLGSFFLNFMRRYESEVSPKHSLGLNGINCINALKYEDSGFYKFHIDHHFQTPRTLTAILLLNNDYEGGELQFCNPLKEDEIFSVDAAVARLIIWPSNFMFPHRVQPVTKGTRFSIVSWAF